MYVGVDVGTGSARACLMNEQGEILAIASQPIRRFTPKPDFINQSSKDIWHSIAYCTKKIIFDAQIDPEIVKGLAFDATCSLVATMGPAGGSTIPVGPDFSDTEQDVLLWMDHRARDQTKRIKETCHPLLKYVGGQMSIEMEIPKIMWLKENLPPDLYKKAHFYDLSDWLTMHSTGVDARSFCSVACKQGYVPHGVDNSTIGWNKEFLTSIGLEDLASNAYERMGGIAGLNGTYHSAGEPVGKLSERAAADLGLTTSTIVGSGVIDAYSGWIGTVAAETPELKEHAVSSRLAAVAGTSTCHIVQSEEPIFVPGVWGPYRDVLVPGMWCAEGGQSTTGELINFIVTNHPAHAQLEQMAKEHNINKYEWLNNRLEQLRKEQNLPSIYYLTKSLFWYGDLYGNRSPIADSNMRGSVVGLSMDISLDDLARQYLGVVEFICQQQRQIIDAMNSRGHSITTVYLSGGQCRNNVLTDLMATCAGIPVVIPKYIDSAVVLGTAMLAAKAANPSKSLWETMSEFSSSGSVVFPLKDAKINALLKAKYEVMLDQADKQREYRKKVEDALSA